MISICLATRKRPEPFKKLCQSALLLADNPKNVEFVSYHDDDDRTKYEYFGNHREVIGPRSIDIFKMANECQKAATGPIFMFTADDFYFETPHWDTEVLKEFEKYQDKIVLVCPDGDSWFRWAWGPVGFVHKNWIDALGYLLPPCDGGQAADKWLDELARSIGRNVRLMSVVVQHTNRKDFIHRKKNARCREGRWTWKYRQPDMIEQRKKDAEKLRCLLFKQ